MTSNTRGPSLPAAWNSSKTTTTCLPVRRVPEALHQTPQVARPADELRRWHRTADGKIRTDRCARPLEVLHEPMLHPMHQGDTLGARKSARVKSQRAGAPRVGERRSRG